MPSRSHRDGAWFNQFSHWEIGGSDTLERFNIEPKNSIRRYNPDPFVANEVHVNPLHWHGEHRRHGVVCVAVQEVIDQSGNDIEALAGQEKDIAPRAQEAVTCASHRFILDRPWLAVSQGIPK